MELLKLLCLILFLTLSYVAFAIIIPPLNFPKNIPTIPFYVVFLPVIFPIDQTELYDLYIRESMEKYGAVKFFFGSRWNILVSRSEYLAQIFKDEDTFAKSGNQRKSHTVLLPLTQGTMSLARMVQFGETTEMLWQTGSNILTMHLYSKMQKFYALW